MPKHIFISYSSEDQPAAVEICAQLEQAGIACWIAPRDVMPGKDYGEEIITAIEATRIMVLVLSDKANASVHVKHEVERAVTKQKIVIPFRIEEIQPSKALEFFISSAHWIDAYVPPLEVKVRLLADTIRTMLGLPAPAAAPNPAPADQNPAPMPVRPVQPALIASEPKSIVVEARITPELPPLPQVAEWVSDPEIREIVVKAVNGVQIHRYIGNDLNSQTIWQDNLACYKGREIPELCLFIEHTQDPHACRRATLLLYRSLSVREGWPYIARVLPLCPRAFISSPPNSGVRNEARTELTDFIQNAKASREEKWTVLTEVLRQPASGSIIPTLIMFIPPGKKEQTIQILLESLERETSSGGGGDAVAALRNLQAVGHKPRLRTILSQSANFSVADKIAQLLTEWRDSEAVPYIREAVENFRYATSAIASLLRDLYALQGPAAIPYIGEVLLDASVPVQVGILREIDSLGGPALRESVQQLAEMAFDQALKQLVDAYLSKTAPAAK
jgi:hypothetical protein